MVFYKAAGGAAGLAAPIIGLFPYLAAAFVLVLALNLGPPLW